MFKSHVKSEQRRFFVTSYKAANSVRRVVKISVEVARAVVHVHCVPTRSSAIAEGPRDASCQLKSCQLPRNSAETTYTTSPDQIDGMKLEI